MNNCFYIKSGSRASRELAGPLRVLFKDEFPLVVLCIGTMRVQGDSLGPMVGSCLCRRQLPGVYVYGTEDAPVHALNLEETLATIRREHPEAYVLAVDAAIGNWNMLGQITVGTGPLYPGEGLKKELPAAGDSHITGVVGVPGVLSFLSLRLASAKLVRKLVQEISNGIVLAFETAHTEYN